MQSFSASQAKRQQALLLLGTVLTNPWIPTDPTPKQAQFLTLTELEAFYGGAAGGGKSEALLMAAAQYLEVPGYAAILFRKSYADLALPGALMDRAHDWWGPTNAKWDDDDKTWRFPTGATISFGYLEYEAQKYRYAGAEFQFVGFDETTQFPETNYRFLFSRLRKKEGMPVPIRMRGASNPGGIGHEWVKQRFLIEGVAEDRPFIPARLDDNPFVDKAYKKSLDQLDPLTRMQLLEGDWDAAAGGMQFKRIWFKDLDAVPHEFERLVRAWDFAATAPQPGRESEADWSVGVLMGRTPNPNRYVVLDVVRQQGTPGDIELLVRQTALNDEAYFGEGAVEIFIEQEPGASGIWVRDHYVTRVLPIYPVQFVRSTGPKPVRAIPYSNQAQAGNVYYVPGIWSSKYFEELEAFPEVAHDDQVDASSLAFNQLALGGELRTAGAGIRDMFSWQG